MNEEFDKLGHHDNGNSMQISRKNGETTHKNGVENAKSNYKNHEEFEQTPIWIAVMTYIAYAILILFGYLRDFMRFYGLEKSRAYKEKGNTVCYFNIYFFSVLISCGRVEMLFHYTVDHKNENTLVTMYLMINLCNYFITRYHRE